MSARDYLLLRLASLVEALTLLALVGVAVPLKHLLGAPQAVTIVGPVHGLAFLGFCWLLTRAASAGDWTRGETALALAAACVPFGGFFNERRFAARAAAG
jgi:integral membrane protein